MLQTTAVVQLSLQPKAQAFVLSVGNQVRSLILQTPFPNKLQEAIVEGYAVNFIKFTHKQQLEVLKKTFHNCF